MAAPGHTFGTLADIHAYPPSWYPFIFHVLQTWKAQGARLCTGQQKVQEGLLPTPQGTLWTRPREAYYQTGACTLLLRRIHAPHPVGMQSVHRSEANAVDTWPYTWALLPFLPLVCPHLALQEVVVYSHVEGQRLCAMVHRKEKCQ